MNTNELAKLKAQIELQGQRVAAAEKKLQQAKLDAFVAGKGIVKETYQQYMAVKIKENKEFDRLNKLRRIENVKRTG